MNYTGFGQDPNYIYSFRKPTSNAPAMGLETVESGAMSQLRSSTGYKQAGVEGKARMERVVSMGLPANTDINRIELAGYGYYGQPVYRAPRPQPFGTFSGFGPTEEERKQREEARTQRAMMNRGGPQPAQQASVPFTPPERSLGTSAESPLAFTGFGRMTGESAYRTPTIPQTVQSPIPSGTTGMLTSFGGIPRFPFSGY